MLVAGKFEEREDRVPKLETLNSLGCMSSMNLVLTKQGLLHMELLLLETFQWNLYLPTAAHFIDYYLSIAVSEGDLHDGWPMTCLEKTRLYLAKYVDYFLEASLQGEWARHPSSCSVPCKTPLLLLPQTTYVSIPPGPLHSALVPLQLPLLFCSSLPTDHVFLCFAPSLVAAACAASSRLILHLSPTWPPRLQLLTGYTWDNLIPCAEKLLMYVPPACKFRNDATRRCQPLRQLLPALQRARQ